MTVLDYATANLRRKLHNAEHTIRSLLADPVPLAKEDDCATVRFYLEQVVIIYMRNSTKQ